MCRPSTIKVISLMQFEAFDASVGINLRQFLAKPQVLPRRRPLDAQSQGGRAVSRPGLDGAMAAGIVEAIRARSFPLCQPMSLGCCAQGGESE